MVFTSKSAEDTKKLGEKIAIDVIGSKKLEVGRSGVTVLALSGNLGSGKTTFLQGFAKGLGIRQRIISPTFILLRKYVIPKRTQNEELKTKNQNLKLENFYHIDLYRLEKDVERELVNLGFQEIISDPSNIIAIEWAEKAKGVYPKNTTWIEFEYLEGDKRKIKVKNDQK